MSKLIDLDGLKVAYDDLDNKISSLTSDVSDNTSARHTHSNKDTLDSITSSLLSSILMTRTPPTNINDITETGLYDVTNANTGIPVAYTGYLIHIRQSTQAALQLYTRTTSTNRVLYMRKKQSGSWGTWGSITFTAI